VAAATAARAQTIEGNDDPWHLRLRDDGDVRRAGSWLVRLLNPLVALRKRSVPDQGRSWVTPPRALGKAAGAQDGALISSELAATGPPSERMPASAPRCPAIQSGPALAGGSRLRPGEWERSESSDGFLDPRVRSPEASVDAVAAMAPRAAATPAENRPIAHQPPDLLMLPAPRWGSSSAPGAGRDPARALVARYRDQTDRPIVPVEARASLLPAALPETRSPPSRLAEALAGKPTTTGESGEDPTAWRRLGPPIVARRRSGARVSTRRLAIAGTVAGAFVLGLYAGGGVLRTGVDLGKTLLAWSGPAPAPRANPRPGPDRAPTTAQPARGVQRIGADHAAAARASLPPGQTRGPAPDGPPWDVLYARGHHFQLEGKLFAAAEAYRQAIRANPQQAAVLYDLGYVLQLQGDTKAAIGYYREAITQQPRHAFAHYNLGTLLQAKGDPDAAIEHYRQAAAIEPGNPYIYYDWARSLETVGDRAGAAALYRKSIALDPGHRPARDARQRLAAMLPPEVDRAP
jgi:TolA-binding protein